jgi:hypothetical protein
MNNLLINELKAEGADLGASFGYTASWYPNSKPGWQNWKFFTKTYTAETFDRNGQPRSCDTYSSVDVADLINAGDDEGLAKRVRLHFARKREEIAAGKRFIFPLTGSN